MNRFIASAVFLLLAGCQGAASAAAAPWVCYGQTAVDQNASVIDPQPNVNGLIGECRSLPYVVPAGYRLAITAYGVEGYAGLPGGIVLAPGFGDVKTNARFLPSAQAGAGVGTKELTGLNFVLPAGSVLNVMLQNAQPPGVFGWFLIGRLDPAQ